MQDILTQHTKINKLRRQLKDLNFELLTSIDSRFSEEMWIFKHNQRIDKLAELLSEIDLSRIKINEQIQSEDIKQEKLLTSQEVIKIAKRN